MKSKIEKFISNKIEQGLYPGGQVLVAYEGNVI